jgi:hypothetical protein
MNDVVRAELPADLADALIGEGFEEFAAFRGLLSDAGTVMTVASVGLAAGANVATILVSREAIAEFVSVMRDWLRRRVAGQPGEKLAIDVSAGRQGEETRLRIRAESRNGTLELDAVALTAFITSLFPDSTSGTAPDEGSASG